MTPIRLMMLSLLSAGIITTNMPAATIIVPDDHATIQEAIVAAVDGDTILISPGSYDEELDTLGKNITLRGINGYPQTIIDSGGDTATLLAINSAKTNLLVEGITFRNGQNTSMVSMSGGSTASFVSCRWLGGTASDGAALSITDSTVTFTDCQWVSNQSTATGGAIHATTSTLTFNNGKFITNQCSGTAGGAMWLDGCTLDMTGTEFTSNQCNSGTTSVGGAIWMRDSSGTWTDCEFDGNSTSSDTDASAGDVLLENSSPTITGCAFTGSLASTYRNSFDNYTLTSGGGSFYLGSASSPVFSNVVFESCVARSETINNAGGGNRFSNARSRGGAVYCGSSCNPSFNNCQMDNCEAFATGNGGSGSCCDHGNVSTCAYGGAIWANNASPAVNGCTFNNCSSTRSSSGNVHGTNIAYGGVFYLENLASPSVLSSTFSNCTGQFGAVIYATSQSSPFVSDSIFTGNTSSERAGAIYSNDASPSFAGCLFQDNTASDGGAFYSDGSAGYFPQVGTSAFCGNVPQNYSGTVLDDGGNVFLDRCGDDCNENGVSDAYEIENGEETDCNDNGALDSCELEATPELDCDGNGVIDSCESKGGNDCDGDGVLDECEDDCNGNLIPDDCEIISGDGTDCDGDGVLDECQITENPGIDCNGNGLPDSCDTDCDMNGTADECEIAQDPSIDCNLDGILDSCQLDTGDLNNNGTLDECETLDFAGVEIEIAPITGVIRNEASLIPLSAVSYRIYATFNDPAARLLGVYGNGDGTMILTSDGGFYNDPVGGDTAADRACDEGAMFPELAFDSFVTVGGDCASNSSEQNIGLDFSGFNSGGSLVDDDGIVLIYPDVPDQGFAGEGGRVLVAQLTTLGGTVPDGKVNLVGTNGDGSDFRAFQMTWGTPPLIDCNTNGQQDAIDIGSGASLDCNLNGVPDDCETEDPYVDCNQNGTPDWCDISSGTSSDSNGNGRPDECECEGDVNADGLVNVDDIIEVILAWGEVGANIADVNGDLVVDGGDLGIVIGAYGGCF